jgi:hypothetical protein
MDESTQPEPSRPTDDRVRERTFVRRDQPVVLRELNDVVAVRADQSVAGSGRTVPPDVAHLLPQSQVDSFERDGWRFVAPAATEAASANTRASKVFLGRGDRVLLGTNNLTVKLRTDAPDDEVNRLLEPFASRVVVRLPIGRGVFRIAVDPADPRDAIDIANALTASGLVEFAEPELIEVFGSR